MGVSLIYSYHQIIIKNIHCQNTESGLIFGMKRIGLSCVYGHYHQCETQGIGEQEFLELDYQNAVDRINQSMDEWNYNDITPKGFRMRGCNQESKSYR